MAALSVPLGRGEDATLAPTDVVGVGEVMVALAGEGRLEDCAQLRKTVGGTEANTLIGLSRLGLNTLFVTRVGADPLGVEIVRTLRGEGVGLSMPEVLTGTTGVMFKEVRGPEVHVHYLREHSAARELTPGDLPDVRARRAHATGITLMLGEGPRETARELFRQVRQAGGHTSFDPNFRARLSSAQEAREAWLEILPLVDDLLLSRDEARILIGEEDPVAALPALGALGPSRVVLRDGAQGCWGQEGEGEVVHVPAFAVPVLDSVGAGDSFTAGYLHGLLTGKPFEACLQAASWVAAQVVAMPGDYQGCPRISELEAWSQNLRRYDR